MATKTTKAQVTATKNADAARRAADLAEANGHGPTAAHHRKMAAIYDRMARGEKI